MTSEASRPLRDSKPLALGKKTDLGDLSPGVQLLSVGKGFFLFKDNYDRNHD
jgi:hypothetical protein